MSSVWVLRTEAYEGLGMAVGAEAEACEGLGMAVGAETGLCEALSEHEVREE